MEREIQVNCRELRYFADKFHKDTKVSELEIDEQVRVFPRIQEIRDEAGEEFYTLRIQGLVSQELKGIKSKKIRKLFEEHCPE